MQYMPAPEKEEAVVYVRVSSTRQGEQGTSLETQEQACRDWAETRGYNLRPENVLIEVESAAFMDRPVLEALLKKVRNKGIHVVVCYDPDRLTRDPRDSVNIIHTFLETGVRVEFVHGPSDTSPEGQLIMYILGFSAQKERLQFMERAMRGKAAAARAGRMPATGGVGLYGYDYDPANRCRVINEQEATVVRQMFQWAMDYFSTYRIACMLNENNIPSKTGKKWSQSRVKRTLQNIAYTGVQYYGKFRHQTVQGGKRIVTPKPISEAILVEGFTPKIISPEFWTTVQERLATRPGRWAGKGRRYLMTGFTRCGKCGGPVVGGMLSPGAWYYRCINTRPRAERPAFCDSRYIRGMELESVSWDTISHAIKNPEILSNQVQHLADTGEGDLGQMKRTLTRDITHLKRQQAQLLDQRQHEYIDQEILQSKIAPLKLLCDEKEQQLRALKEQQSRRDDAVAAAERIADYCQQIAERLDHMDFEEKRATFAAFGVAVVATPDDLVITMVVDPGATTMSPSSSAPRPPSGRCATSCGGRFTGSTAPPPRPWAARCSTPAGSFPTTATPWACPPTAPNSSRASTTPTFS